MLLQICNIRLKDEACSFPLNPKVVYTIFKYSVLTAKRIQHFPITKINFLTPLDGTIPVYAENHAELINAKCRVTDH